MIDRPSTVKWSFRSRTATSVFCVCSVIARQLSHRLRSQNGRASDDPESIVRMAETRECRFLRRVHIAERKDNRSTNAQGLAANQESDKAALALPWDGGQNATDLECTDSPAVQIGRASCRERV